MQLSCIQKALRNPSLGIRYLINRGYGNLSRGVIGPSSRLGIGTNVLDECWHVCVILDTCRVDALRAVASEYDFINNIDRIISVGGTSSEWIARTFDTGYRQTLAETAYLTSNAFAQYVLEDRLKPDNEHYDHSDLVNLRESTGLDPIDASELGKLEHVWKQIPKRDTVDGAHDMSKDLMAGGTPPRYVTDRAISMARNHDYDRMILHYTQPHHPYLANSLDTERSLRDHEKQPFQYLRKTGDREKVWSSYLDELRWVLDDVDLLLRNIEAEDVLITADHGEAFGEYGIYNHHAGSVHPHIRLVPWVTTEGADTESYVPDHVPKRTHDISPEDQLEALGYKL